MQTPCALLLIGQRIAKGLVHGCHPYQSCFGPHSPSWHLFGGGIQAASVGELHILALLVP